MLYSRRPPVVKKKNLGTGFSLALFRNSPLVHRVICQLSAGGSDRNSQNLLIEPEHSFAESESSMSVHFIHRPGTAPAPVSGFRRGTVVTACPGCIFVLVR